MAGIYLTPRQEHHLMFMLFIPTNLTTRSAEPVKNDSLIFPYPIKVISGYYRIQGSAQTGLNDRQQAMKLVESFEGTEIMFDIILYADARTRVIGHMYQEGSHGEFIIMGANSLAFYAKYDGVWSGNDLLK